MLYLYVDMCTVIEQEIPQNKHSQGKCCFFLKKTFVSVVCGYILDKDVKRFFMYIIVIRKPQDKTDIL